jgi:transcriptional regulator with XRE-family HTH domain
MKSQEHAHLVSTRVSAFANRLRELRAAAGLTQYALAMRAKLTPQAVYQLEAGRCEPMWSTVLRLAAALEVTADDFAH